MNKISIRPVYKNDHELINFWIKNSLISEKKKNFKILNKNKIKILVSDNIRIGMRILKKNKKFYFIYPTYYTFGYLDKFFLNKVYGKDFEDVKTFYKEIENLEDTTNITINKKIFKNIKKKILLLGNNSRNKKLIIFLKKKNCNISISNKYLKIKDILNKKFDFIISSGYQFKINDNIIKEYSGKIFNLHATFLPWGKGIGTTLFSFILKQPTGSSIHLIDKQFDTGDIILRKTFKAATNDTTRTFYNKLMKITENIAISNLPQILNSNFKRFPQKNFIAKPPYFSRFDFEKIIRILPLGYDTKIKTLIGLGNILKENKKFIDKL